MKIYISGPISDKENLNRKTFKDAENLLRKLNHVPVNPHNLYDPNKYYTYEDYLRLDLRALLDCEAIYLLKGWERSKGALIEVSIANVLNLKFIYEGEL